MHTPLFQQKLIAWYASHKRDLPWRKTTDPYRILVSEIMLQQTQVDRVIPKYTSFLQHFPTLQALASASLGDVLASWSGLGFNRRAKYLHEIAKSGAIPKTPQELRKLKGVGEYTSHAVASFVYNYPVAVVDINVKRVYHRIFFGNNPGEHDIEAISQNVLPQDSRTWNNAIMDLGALICIAENPLCFSCPFSSSCKAFQEVGSPRKIILIAAPTQSKFVGSMRYYRGQFLKIVTERKEIGLQELQVLLQKKGKWVMSLATTMEKEGLVILNNGIVRLP